MKHKVALDCLLSAILIVMIGWSLTGCNKDETIGGMGKPSIELDSETGVYTVKIGEELTVSPLFKNVSEDQVEWSIEGRVVRTGYEFTYVWDKDTTCYVMITAANSSGTTREEIRVEIMALTPPVISLFLPEGGLKLTPGSACTLTPDIQHSDLDGFAVSWYLDGNLVGSESSYTFSADSIGVYRVEIRASNIDGSDSKEFDVEVVDHLPKAVTFLPPSYYQPSTDRFTFVGRPVFLSPVRTDFVNPAFVWKVDGETVESVEPTLRFVAESPGEYVVEVIVTDNEGTGYNYRLSRNVTVTGEYGATVKVICVDSTESSRMRPQSSSSSTNFDKVYEWLPAPGQFINETAMGGAERSLESAVAWAEDCLKSSTPVSLGAFGGYIIVGFDHSVVASSSGDYDFEVGGNAFKSGSGDSNEPGIVWVMQDINGNGQPDDEWYELKGSEFSSASTVRKYAVTYYRPEAPEMNVVWSDNYGGTGTIDYMGIFHRQSYYYPDWMESDTYTLYGTKLRPTNSYDESTGVWSNNPLEWGYADNYGSDNVDSSRGQWTGFRISNAVYEDGSEVGLQYIDFVKVQTGIQSKSGRLGELSTEVSGFRDSSMK